MASDRAIGLSIFIISIIIIIIYGYLLLTPYSLAVLKATAFVAVAAVFGILAWIGYTLATTPPPQPIEEIEKELEEELKRLEEAQRSSE